MYALHATQNAKTVTTGVASANTTLPTHADGTPAKLVRITVSGGCYVAFGDSGVTAASATGMLLTAGASEVFVTIGRTHIAHIDGPGASVTVNLTPIDSVR